MDEMKQGKDMSRQAGMKGKDMLAATDASASAAAQSALLAMFISRLNCATFEEVQKAIHACSNQALSSWARLQRLGRHPQRPQRQA